MPTGSGRKSIPTRHDTPHPKQIKKGRPVKEKLPGLPPFYFFVTFFLTTFPFSKTTIGVLVCAAISLARLAARLSATPTLARSSS